ncbi:MAG: MBL fold metallo-hydrolase [Planctomycetes bacterium]|nr:MBL fold metallo-hydrolase [Planctomycetota bacterium]
MHLKRSLAERHIPRGEHICCIALSLFVSPLVAQTIEYTRADVAENVYAFIPSEIGVGNAVAIIGDTDVLVVDSTATPSGARAVIAEIRKLTPKPVRYLVNTHWHDDHIWGNQAFRAAFPNVVIIAHENTRQDMIDKAIPSLAQSISGIRKKLEARDEQLKNGKSDDGRPLSEERRTFLNKRQVLFKHLLNEIESVTPTLPTITFQRRLVLYQGSQQINLLSLGKGHTRGDIVIHIPASKVVIAGDLITYPIPAGAFVFERIETMRKLARIDQEVIVPGHGPVMRNNDYVLLITSLLEKVVSRVRQALDQELSLEETQKGIDVEGFRARLGSQDLVPTRAFERFFLRPAVEQAYKELKER